MYLSNAEKMALVRSAEDLTKVIMRLNKVNKLDMKVSQGKLQEICDYLHCAGYVISDLLKEAN